MKKEVWKPVVGYEGLYEVSDQGVVRSLFNGKNKILKLRKTNRGYLKVTLVKNKVQKEIDVHRLVAEAFVLNPDNKPQVNHINEDKTDNRACNLNWMTPKENCNYGTRNKKCAKALSKPVKQLTMDKTLITIWPSASEAGKKNKFDNSAISACCRGKYKQYKGYIWQYT